MNFYSVMSKGYDLMDVIYFAEKGNNPRNVIQSMIPDEPVKILDLCCGTLSNTFSIAKAYSQAKVMGIDLSKQMLTVARKKRRKADLSNIYLKCADATNTNLKAGTFDYVVIGLVLHESSPELQEGILKEAHRILKDDGNLIILEWERQESLLRRIKYSPLHLLEKLYCKTFESFYQCDKKEFFKELDFETEEEIHCNYSVVLKLKKAGR